MRFAELQQALAVFGLSGRATLADIRRRHRELVKRHHPDAGGEGDPAKIREINAASSVLREYCRNYRFSFAEEEFYEQNADERLLRQFDGDPIWGAR